MEPGTLQGKTILITGGTSGLGFELAREFLERGCKVEITGRTLLKIPRPSENFHFSSVDFSNLSSVAHFAREFSAGNGPVDLVINNAGVLSPPGYHRTEDGYEHTFQVNFLSHLLLNHILAAGSHNGQTLKIMSVISPVYKIGRLPDNIYGHPVHYHPFRTYSSSKYCQTLMNQYFTEFFPQPYVTCFSYDPGIFRSGIYRLQHRWFRNAYHLAAPVMNHPAGIASRMADLIARENPEKGSIYNRKGLVKPIIQPGSTVESSFLAKCGEMISPFIQQKE